MDLSPLCEAAGPLEPSHYPTHAHNEVVDQLNKVVLDTLQDFIDDPVVVPFQVNINFQKAFARSTGKLIIQEGGNTHSKVAGNAPAAAHVPANGHAYTHALSILAEREFENLRQREGTLEVGPALTNLPQGPSDSLMAGRTQARYIKAHNAASQTELLSHFFNHSSGAQASNQPAHYIYANMVAHDLSYIKVYDIFRRHSAIRGRFSLFLPTPLIVGANFTDANTGCSYEFDKIGNKVHMHLPDLSFSYTHDYDTWVSWLTEPLYNGPEFSLSFEIVRNYGPVAIVEVHRVTTADTLIRSFVPYKRDVVRIPDIAALLPIIKRTAGLAPFDINTAAGLLNRVRKLKYYELPTEIYNRCGQFLSNRADKDMSRQTAGSYVSASTFTITVGQHMINRGISINPDDFDHIVLALLISTMVRRYYSTQVLSYMITNIQKAPETGFFRAVVDAIKFAFEAGFDSDPYTANILKELAGFTKRHYVLWCICTRTYNSPIQFKSTLVEHGLATHHGVIPDGRTITIDPDDDGYCFHHCAKAVTGHWPMLPRHPLASACQAWMQSKLKDPQVASGIQLGPHCTVDVTTDDVCRHYRPFIISATHPSKPNRSYREPWQDTLYRAHSDPLTGLNNSKTASILNILLHGQKKKRFLAKKLVIHNFCALPLNDLAAWDEVSTHEIHHHAHVTDNGHDASRLMVIPAGHHIHTHTNITCMECTPTGDIAVCDIGEEDISTDTIQAAAFLLHRTQKSYSIKIQSFWSRINADQAFQARVTAGSVFSFIHANPWEKFLIATDCPSGYYQQVEQSDPRASVIYGGMRFVNYKWADLLRPLTTQHHWQRLVKKLLFIATHPFPHKAACGCNHGIGMMCPIGTTHCTSGGSDHDTASICDSEAPSVESIISGFNRETGEYRVDIKSRILDWLARSNPPPVPVLPSAPPMPPQCAPTTTSEAQEAPPTPSAPPPDTTPTIDIVCAPADLVTPTQSNQIDSPDSDPDSDLIEPSLMGKKISKLTISITQRQPTEDLSRIFIFCNDTCKSLKDEQVLLWLQENCHFDRCISYIQYAAILKIYEVEDFASLPDQVKQGLTGKHMFFEGGATHKQLHGVAYKAGDNIYCLPYPAPNIKPAPVKLDFGFKNAKNELRALIATLDCKPTDGFAAAHKEAQKTLKGCTNYVSSPKGEYTCINGIPGSGKSKFIMQTYETGQWDLIITPTSALKEEYVNAGCSAASWASAIPAAAGANLIIDEAYLFDPAVICYYACVASKVLLVGDSMQQKYDSNNRTKGNQSACKSLSEAVTGEVPRISISRAVPLDIMCTLAKKFTWAADYTTTNPLINSIDYKMIKTIVADPTWATRKRTAFTFSKRSNEIHHVSTVASIQGLRQAKCDLLITGHCSATVFKVPAQLYVALTRHTAKLTIGYDNAGVKRLIQEADVDFTVGSRDAFETITGYRAVPSVSFDTGTYSSDTNTITKPDNSILTDSLANDLNLRPSWMTSHTNFSVPMSCQVNKAIYGGFQLFAVDAPASDLPKDLNPADIEEAEVVIPLGNHCGATALVEDILQKIAPSSSDPYEARRETGYQDYGKNRAKTLRLRNSGRPFMNPEASVGTRVIPLARCRSRTQSNRDLDHCAQTVLSRYTKPKIKMTPEQVSAESDRLFAGFCKFIDLKKVKKITPEDLMLAEAEMAANIVRKHNPARQEEGLYGQTRFSTSTISCFNKSQEKAGLKTDFWLQGTQDHTGFHPKGGQGISAQPKTLNHIFAAWNRATEQNLLACLKRGVVLPNGMSPDRFKREFDAAMKAMPSDHEVVCIDISEQDTTKTDATHDFIRRVYELFGVPESVIKPIFAALSNWQARGFDYRLDDLTAFQSGVCMTYFHNTLDSMARFGSSFDFTSPFVYGPKGDDGVCVAAKITQLRHLPELKIERGKTGTFVGFLVGDSVTLDLPRLCNKVACRTYRTQKDIDEYRVAVTDWLTIVRSNEDAARMCQWNAYHYGLTVEEAEHLWGYLVRYASGKTMSEIRARNPNFVLGELKKKLLPPARDAKW